MSWGLECACRINALVMSDLAGFPGLGVVFWRSFELFWKNPGANREWRQSCSPHLALDVSRTRRNCSGAPRKPFWATTNVVKFESEALQFVSVSSPVYRWSLHRTLKSGLFASTSQSLIINNYFYTFQFAQWWQYPSQCVLLKVHVRTDELLCIFNNYNVNYACINTAWQIMQCLR